jgi:outer membrane protein assembly factor BamC
LILKEDTSSQTNVIFVDLSEENDEKIISYSEELFDQIASKF